MKRFIGLGLALVLILLAGCARYTTRPLPFRAPESYANHRQVAGAVIAARAFTDPRETEEAFGFDMIGAGLLPVQIIADNKGPHPLVLVADKILLMDDRQQFWQMLKAQAAYERLVEKNKAAGMVSQGASSAAVGGAAGAIVGFALGVVTGSNVTESTSRGAVAGAAIGAIKGGTEGRYDQYSRNQISQDLAERSLKDRPFTPHEITHGFLFFPAEAKSPRLLRLKLRERDTGVEHDLEFQL